MRKNKVTLGQRGFSLIEIILVVIIMATLTAMVVPHLSGRSEQARQAAAKADIEVNIPTALKLYELDNGFLPVTTQGLNALLQKPTTTPIPENWNGPYIEKQPLDPWKHPYQYQSPGTHRPHDYDLWSFGKDPKPESTKDDIVNWGVEPAK